eukprot:40208-Rhodomonas_salina.1
MPDTRRLSPTNAWNIWYHHTPAQYHNSVPQLSTTTLSTTTHTTRLGISTTVPCLSTEHTLALHLVRPYPKSVPLYATSVLHTSTAHTPHQYRQTLRQYWTRRIGGVGR